MKIIIEIHKNKNKNKTKNPKNAEIENRDP